MPIHIGTEENLSGIFVGTQPIGRVYVGTNLVWQSTPAFSGFTGSGTIGMGSSGGIVDINIEIGETTFIRINNSHPGEDPPVTTGDSFPSTLMRVANFRLETQSGLFVELMDGEEGFIGILDTTNGRNAEIHFDTGENTAAALARIRAALNIGPFGFQFSPELPLIWTATGTSASEGIVLDDLPGIVSTTGTTNYEGAQVIYYDSADNMTPSFFDGINWAVPVVDGTVYQLVIYPTAADQVAGTNPIVTTSASTDQLGISFGVGDAVFGGSTTQAQTTALIGISTANDLLNGLPNPTVGQPDNRVYVIPNDHCTVTRI